MDVLLGVLLLAVLFALPVGYLWIMGYVAAQIIRDRGRREEWVLLALVAGPIGLAIVYMLPPTEKRRTPINLTVYAPDPMAAARAVSNAIDAGGAR